MEKAKEEKKALDKTDDKIQPKPKIEEKKVEVPKTVASKDISPNTTAITDEKKEPPKIEEKKVVDEWETSPKAKVEKPKAKETDEWGDLSKSTD